MDIEEAFRVLEEVFGAFCENDGISQETLDSTVLRSGVVLPEALQVLYRRAGRSSIFRHGESGLAEPGSWKIVGGHLVFYTEPQGVCSWGVDQQQPFLADPPVSTSYLDADGSVVWKEHFASVSEFCCVQGIWRATGGGLPFSALVVDASCEMIEGVANAASRCGRAVLRARTTHVWIIQSCVLGISAAEIGLGGRSARDFFLAAQQLGLSECDWDYYSPRDGL